MNEPPEELINYILEQVRALYAIPAPTFSEQKRADYLLREFNRIGLQQVQQDASGNVLGCHPGAEGKPLVVSAHMDTVHVESAITPLVESAERFSGTGVGDNTLGLAALLGLGRWLVAQQARFPGDVWLAGNVCEEGLGNLAGMKALTARFADKALAYLVVEGMGLGQVCHRGLGVARFRITAETEGGHSWVDFGKPSAIHELAEVITGLCNLALPRKPRSSMNVGVIQGGTSFNPIASRACCELDLRSEEQASLARMISSVNRLVLTREKPGVKLSIEPIGMRPAGAIPPTHALVKLALDVLAELEVTSCLEIGSTDANVPLSQGFPAICIGLTSGGHPHTSKEYIELAPIRQGIAQLMRLVTRAWEALP